MVPPESRPTEGELQPGSGACTHSYASRGPPRLGRRPTWPRHPSSQPRTASGANTQGLLTRVTLCTLPHEPHAMLRCLLRWLYREGRCMRPPTLDVSPPLGRSSTWLVELSTSHLASLLYCIASGESITVARNV